MKTCSFEQCTKKHDSHGYCANHARHYRQYGHPLTEAEKRAHWSAALIGNTRTKGKRWKVADTSKMKGHHPRTEFKKGMTPWNKGIEYTAIKAEKNYAWKGENVSYRNLHRWVERRLGKPDRCEYCKTDGLTERQIHWSNISGNYRRVLSDWQRLCAKCHKAYDSGKLTMAEIRG